MRPIIVLFKMMFNFVGFIFLIAAILGHFVRKLCRPPAPLALPMPNKDIQ